MSFQTAPLAVTFKMGNAILSAVLPIVLTYFAALTTTELAAAFNGDETAGSRALTYVIITLVLGLANTVWSSIDTYIQGILRYKVEAQVSDMMYERFLRLDFWRYDDKDTIDTYDKAQQFARFYAYVFDRLASVFSQLVGMVTAVIALFLVVPFVALVVIIALIPGVYIQFKLSRAQIGHWNKTVDVRRAQRYIEWNLLQPQAIVELRLNNLIRHLLDLRRSYRDKDERERLNFEKKYIGQQILSNVLESAAELTSLIWITLQIIQRAQPLGQFIYVQQIVSRAIGSANSFVTTMSTIDEDLAQLFDYQKFMDYPLQATGKKQLTATPEHIRLDNVSFHYYQAKEPVLKNISLEIKRGQHVAIVGENGAGKSTFVKLLLGLYAPTSGKLLLDNVKLGDYTIESWHRQLSVLQQDFQQYNFTDIENNVYYGDVSSPIDKKRYERAMQKSESREFVSHLSKADKTYPSTWMEDETGEKGVNLSGGQWQRIALGRSFYRDTPIIILDEPTSAIDALAEARIFKHLFADKGRTIITISHRLTTVEKADIIYVLKEGELIEQGTHNELVNNGGDYVTIFADQLRHS